MTDLNQKRLFLSEEQKKIEDAYRKLNEEKLQKSTVDDEKVEKTVPAPIAVNERLEYLYQNISKLSKAMHMYKPNNTVNNKLKEKIHEDFTKILNELTALRSKIDELIEKDI